MDFLDRLGIDLSSKILMNLEDPSDIVRVSSVSRSWRHFVIANGFVQQLCLRMFPQLSRVSRVIELNKCTVIEPAVGSSHSAELETLEKDHRVYNFLARVCTSSHVYGCIQRAICASSTDSYPGKRVENTLSACRAFYWSSKGQSNPAMPEALTYELVSKFCIITEINICPFEAYFQLGSPIYSAKSVRFRLGYSKTSNDVGKGLLAHSYPSADDKFIWTYTSQEFPMAQKSDTQKFKLPEPVLCVGGILQIELLGRVQRNKADGLFYICMAYVQVVGRSLSPAFGVEILEPSGKFVLLQNKLEKFHDQPIDAIETIARFVQSSAGDLWQIVNRL
ncbi:hypothetical protein FH972_004189 [Carpinus fangiana]|uniref:F-box domain-containing protein n=1 Tax=Carpinus fangiana TaxID=176857 RepID=A0A5N6QKB2_9ROSI|nr:hypothetical protein FH972_004189 [Carpinus fangiana]